MEYDYAVSSDVPVLGFVRKDISNVPSKFVDNDPIARQKLNSFREKVMSRTCRPYGEAAELGMLVMKSLMSETRTNPGVGWVRANQARGKEDIEREQQMADDLLEKDKQIKRLQRKIRDLRVPLPGISITDLAQGDDIYSLSVSFQDASKRLIFADVSLTWNEIFSVIGPVMYGYIVRRGRPDYKRLVGQYSFEGALLEYVRSKIIDQCGNRQINIMPHQIDTILIQFKELGLVAYSEKTKDEDGEDFRGYSLTVAGEAHLTRLKIQKAN